MNDMCDDCGTVVVGRLADVHEWYVVHDDVWEDAGMPVSVPYSGAGVLCVGCIEHRLGRQLNADDFAPAPLNSGLFFDQSARLVSRLESHE
jgi:hypothetical protein